MQDMAPRGPYKKGMDAIRARVVQAFDDQEDWQTVARINNVNYQTAYSWVRAYLREDTEEHQKRGRKPKLSEHEIEEVTNWIAIEPLMTLNDIRDRILAEFNIVISITAISNHLDGRLITTKNVYSVPAGTNADRTKRLRKQYVESFIAMEQRHKTLIYIGQTNFNVYCKRNRGRSLRGVKACVKVANARGLNLHIIGAIANGSIVDVTTRRGSFTKDRCMQWLRDVVNKVRQNTPIEEIVIVCDNAPCHKGLEELFKQDDLIGVTLLRLSPYSPMLNPIEHMWHALKSKVKADMRANYSELLNGDPSQRMTQIEWRLNFMERIARKAIGELNPDHCTNYIRHVTKYYTMSLNEEDIK